MRKTDVVDLHLANPTWTAKQLAEALGCTQVYINNCRRTFGLNIPRVIAERGSSMDALGRAAAAAGITLEDIRNWRRDPLSGLGVSS